MKSFLKKAVWLINLIFSERLFLYASSLSFNILFVVIPSTLLIFSLGSFFLDIRRDIVGQIMQFVHEQVPFMEPFVKKNIVILVSRGKWLGFASVIVLLWTTSRLFLNLRLVLFEIFSLEEPRNRILHKIKEVASVAVLAILLLIFFFLNSLTLPIRVAVEHLTFSVLAVPVVGETLYLINTFLLVFFIYVTVLGRRVPFKSILYGSFFSTVFLEVMKLSYKFFILYTWRGKTIYGSLWIFLAFFIWLYYSVLGFVAGSELASIKRGHK